MNSNKAFKLMFTFALVLITLLEMVPLNNVAYADEGQIETIYIDGVAVPIDDERIQNVVYVQPSMLGRATRVVTPNIVTVQGVDAQYERPPNVAIDGYTVAAQRYLVSVDGIYYEAFCGNPTRPGPEQAGAAYQLTGEANSSLVNALKHGYPINSEWSNTGISEAERSWYIYATRVAVAMANNPANAFSGDADILDFAEKLKDGELGLNSDSYPPIMLNGVRDASDAGSYPAGTSAQSTIFEITHNRKTNHTHNPFKFEWAAGTPDGAKLVVNGNVIATAPNNPTEWMVEDTTSFHIEMPNTEEYEGKTAKVNLVGIHNAFANKVWMLQNSSYEDNWQDIVFYIPEISASASYSFQRNPIVPGETGLSIIKRNTSGTGLAGAVFTVTGPSGFNRQETTPANGTIELTGLIPGNYTITVRP